MDIPKKRRSLSLLLKSLAALSAVVGTVLSAIAGSRVFMGGSTVFMYFTIQSNIAVALVCAVGAVLLAKKTRIGRGWFIVKLVATVAITLTGVVFCFVLAPTMRAGAWNVQNILTHVVVPVLCIVDFFLTGVYGTLRRSDVFYVILPPLAYAIYAGIGYVRGWQFSPGVNYPYFFLNWGSEAGAFGFSKGLPFMGCGWWILAILVFLILIGLVYLAIVRALQRTEARNGRG